MILIILSVDCITGHNGFDVPFLFYAVGLICAVKVLENNIAYNRDYIQEPEEIDIS